MKKVFVVLCVLSCILFTGCGQKSDSIVLVTEAGFAPYEFYDEGNIVGIDIEIGNKIAEKLGKKLIVKDVAFDSLINELNSGKADFAAAGMSINEERAKQVDFTIEYAVSRQVIVVKNGSSIKNGDDLHNKKVDVQLGSTADIYLSDNYTDVQVVQQKKFLAAAEDVKTGKSDAIVMDYLPAKELVKSNPELVILDGELFVDKYAIAVKKGNKELLDTINSVLNELIKEGKIEEYTLKYSK